ncbi:hypothetical protein BH09ACT5_BH09ACT5_11420 [soil metagenome]
MGQRRQSPRLGVSPICSPHEQARSKTPQLIHEFGHLNACPIRRIPPYATAITMLFDRELSPQVAPAHRGSGHRRIGDIQSSATRFLSAASRSFPNRRTHPDRFQLTIVDAQRGPGRNFVCFRRGGVAHADPPRSRVVVGGPLVSSRILQAHPGDELLAIGGREEHSTFLRRRHRKWPLDPSDAGTKPENVNGLTSRQINRNLQGAHQDDRGTVPRLLSGIRKEIERVLVLEVVERTPQGRLPTSRYVKAHFFRPSKR